jgi:hypothetical protein
MLLLYAIPLGIVAGLARGGALSGLATVRIRLATLAVAGLVFQLILFSPPVAAALGSGGVVGPVLYVGSTLAVLLALLANYRQPGFRLIVVGAVLNLVAIIANGGFMPASPDAWAMLHGAAGLPTNTLTNSTLAGAQTAFAFLGDNFVLPRPLPFANVFSMGDALIAGGGAWFIARTMARRVSPPTTSQPNPQAQPVAANG